MKEKHRPKGARKLSRTTWRCFMTLAERYKNHIFFHSNALQNVMDHQIICINCPRHVSPNCTVNLRTQIVTCDRVEREQMSNIVEYEKIYSIINMTKS